MMMMMMITMMTRLKRDDDDGDDDKQLCKIQSKRVLDVSPPVWGESPAALRETYRADSIQSCQGLQMRMMTNTMMMTMMIMSTNVSMMRMRMERDIQ